MCVPDQCAHTNHALGFYAGLGQPIDQRVKEKIYNLTNAGMDWINSRTFPRIRLTLFILINSRMGLHIIRGARLFKEFPVIFYLHSGTTQEPKNLKRTKAKLYHFSF